MRDGVGGDWLVGRRLDVVRVREKVNCGQSKG